MTLAYTLVHISTNIPVTVEVESATEAADIITETLILCDIDPNLAVADNHFSLTA